MAPAAAIMALHTNLLTTTRKDRDGRGRAAYSEVVSRPQKFVLEIEHSRLARKSDLMAPYTVLIVSGSDGIFPSALFVVRREIKGTAVA